MRKEVLSETLVMFEDVTIEETLNHFFFYLMVHEYQWILIFSRPCFSTLDVFVKVIVF